MLLPGLDGTGDLLKPLAERLAPYVAVRTVAYPLDPRLGYRELAAYVLPALPEAPCVLLGESFSGPIAIELTHDHPSRVCGLVLASSFARHPRPSLLAWLAPLTNTQLMPKGLNEFFLLGASADPQTAEALDRVLRRLPSDVAAARLAEVLRIDRRAALAATRCPLLCLRGRRDRLVPRRSLAEIVTARPDAEVHVLDAPHMLLETHAAEAASIISDFVERIGP